MIDQTTLDCKMYLCINRIARADRAGDAARAKKAAGTAVILARMRAREAVNALVAANAEERAAARSLAKAAESGVTFPLGEQRLRQLQEASARRYKELVSAGQDMRSVLDIWQRHGASLQDLALLCNRNCEQVARTVGCDRLDEPFSGLVFVYNLDYKDNSNRGWIDFDVDAPMTHSIKEYALDMLHTQEGRKAAREAMEACFPEIMENALHIVTDADGVKHLIDKDGLAVATLEEGE